MLHNDNKNGPVTRSTSALDEQLKSRMVPDQVDQPAVAKSATTVVDQEESPAEVVDVMLSAMVEPVEASEPKTDIPPPRSSPRFSQRVPSVIQSVRSLNATFNTCSESSDGSSSEEEYDLQSILKPVRMMRRGENNGSDEEMDELFSNSTDSSNDEVTPSANYHIDSEPVDVQPMEAMSGPVLYGVVGSRRGQAIRFVAHPIRRQHIDIPADLPRPSCAHLNDEEMRSCPLCMVYQMYTISRQNYIAALDQTNVLDSPQENVSSVNDDDVSDNDSMPSLIEKKN